MKRTALIHGGFLLAWFAGAAAPAARGECGHLDDPLQILDFHLELAPEDWDLVRHDAAFQMERPALFRCGDEAPLPVNVRRKNSFAYFWYNSGRPRLVFPWDLDLVLFESNLQRDSRDMEIPRLLFELAPGLRSTFDRILLRITGDLLAPEALEAYLDEIAAAIGSAIEADPLNGLTGGFSAEQKRVRLLFQERLRFWRQRLPPEEPYPVAINEILASNRESGRDESGEAADWIELYNRGGAAVSLQGLYLSDDPARPKRWPLPDILLPAGGRVLIWCDQDTSAGPLHASFALDQDGEAVGLYESPGGLTRAIDFVWFGPQETDVSLGRFPDGAPGLRRLACPTPAAANAAECSAGPPRFIRGDVEADGAVNITDAVQVIFGLFLGARLECWRAADANGDGSADVTDAVAILSYLFLAGEAPPPPFPGCGTDPEAGPLSCASPAICRP